MVLDFLMNMILAMMIIGLFNVIRGFFRIRKILKKYKDDPNVEGITIVNGEVKVIQKNTKQAEEKVVKCEMVKDHINGQEIEKSKAYRVVREEQEYYFATWETRQAFLEQVNN